MNYQSLEEFWDANKQAIGQALPQGTDPLARVLQTGASSIGLTQQLQDAAIHWLTQEGDLALMFCVVSDPRDLDRVLHSFKLARDKRPRLTAIFVHQWTDGEGNWDAFLISPRGCLHHADRISGSDIVQERGPALREDIYTLFACDKEFPAPGQAQWAQLLTGPFKGVAAALAALATEHSCTQTVSDYLIQWTNSDGQLEVQFFILPNSKDINAIISVYEQVRATRCPVSFVFTPSERPGVFDIFRLSARSYLEHHNQAKPSVGERATVTGMAGTPAKELKNLRWVPRWASHVGCIKGCLNYLGVTVSDAWLFGATGHAFVLNISSGLCPSGPTDWDTRRFLKLGRNVGYAVERVDEFCPGQGQDLREAQEKAWKHVRRAIDQCVPCYGWELDLPEYQVIFGYDETGCYISGPSCDEGKGPMPWQDLGRSGIAMVVVASVRSVAPADDRQTVRDALLYALDLAHSRQNWTDRAGGLCGYDAWIRSMENGTAGRFGLGYNAAVWAESRRFAVEFFNEAKKRLSGELNSLFEQAVAHYQAVARNLKAVSDAYPFVRCPHEPVPVDKRSRSVVAALKDARAAEVAGLATLAALVERIQPVRGDANNGSAP